MYMYMYVRVSPFLLVLCTDLYIWGRIVSNSALYRDSKVTITFIFVLYSNREELHQWMTVSRRLIDITSISSQ